MATPVAWPGRRPRAGVVRPLVSVGAAALVGVCALVGVMVSVPVRDAVPVQRALVESSVASAAAAALPSSADESVTARTRALEDLLAARAQALLGRDAQGWMGAVSGAPASTRYADRQRRVFDNLVDVPFASWRWEYAGPGDALTPERVAELGPGGSQAWVAHVVLVHRLRDGGGEVRREQHLTLVPGGDGWLVADDADGPTAVDLWDLGRVAYARGERSVVIGTGDVTPYVTVVDDAAQRVDEVWGDDWPRTSLVEVPATQAELARLLGREDEQGLDQIAAVTTGETSDGRLATTGDRVVVNPEGFDKLGELGRRVVLTHELAHVATRASTRAPVPMWLGEGYADWVGYRGSGLSRQTVADPLLDAVREGEGPTQLATLEDFDPTRGDVAGAYASSWLVVDMLAREHGDRALTSFYRAVASAGPVEADLAMARPLARSGDQGAARLDAALRAHFGIDEAGLTTAWREHLAALAAQAES